MDGQRFDAIARRVATAGTSRRTLAKGAIGGALAGLGALVGAGRAEAAHQTVLCCVYSCPTGDEPKPRSTCVKPGGACNPPAHCRLVFQTTSPDCNTCKTITQ